MSALQPKMISVDLKGLKLDLLCTISAADRIEEAFGVNIIDSAEIFADPVNAPKLLHCLDTLGTSENTIISHIDENNIGAAFEACSDCFLESLPKDGDFAVNCKDNEDADKDSGGDFSLSRLIFLGLTVLNLSYSEILGMTIRQFMVIYSSINRKSSPKQTLDDMIPI